MAKGASIRFTNYNASVQNLLQLMNLQGEIKKYDKVVLKACLKPEEDESTSVAFTEAVLKFIIDAKNPVTQVFIAEGSDGADTSDLFESRGFKALAEKYEIGLLDLNTAETQEMENDKFLKFQSIHYPKILSESFVISLPMLSENEEHMMNDSLSNMLGAFPARQYKGFFSKTKNKLRKFPIRYAIHDIVIAKLPNFSVIDASSQGTVLAGLPLDMDKRAAKLLGIEWKNVPHLKLLEESLSEPEKKDDEIQVI